MITFSKLKTFAPWYNIQPAPKLTKQHWDDLHAEIFEAIIRTLPKQADNKKRTNLALKLTDQCMSVVGRELS